MPSAKRSTSAFHPFTRSRSNSKDKMSGTVQLCMIPQCAGLGVLMCEPCRFYMCLAHVVTHCSTQGPHDPLKYLVDDNKQTIGMMPTPVDEAEDGFTTQPSDPAQPAPQPTAAQLNRTIPPLSYDPVMPTDDVGSPEQLRTCMPPIPSSLISYPFYNAFNGTGAIGSAFPVAVNAFTTQGPVMTEEPSLSAPVPSGEAEPQKKKTSKRKSRAPHPPTACGCLRVPTPPSFASQDRDKKIDRVNKRSETYISCEKGWLCLPLRTKGDTKYFIGCRDLNAAVPHSIQFRFNISHAKDPKIADSSVVRDLFTGAKHYWVIDAPVVSAAEINAHRTTGLLLTYCFKNMKLMLRSSHAKRTRVHDKDYQKHDQMAFPIEIWYKQTATADEFSFYQTFCAFRQRQKPVITPRAGTKRAKFIPLATSDSFDGSSHDDEKCEASDDESTEPTVASPNSSVMTPAATAEGPRAPAFKVEASPPNTDQLSQRSSPTLGAMAGDVANMQLGAGVALPAAAAGATASSAQLSGGFAFPPLQQPHQLQANLGMPGSVPSFTQPFMMPYPYGPAFPNMPRSVPQSASQMPVFSSDVKPEPHSIPFTQSQVAANYGGLPFPVGMGMPSGFSGFPPSQMSREDSLSYMQQLLARNDPRPQPDFVRLAAFSVDNMSFYVNRSVLDRMGDVPVLESNQSVRMVAVVVGMWRSPHQVAEFRLLSTTIHPAHAMLVVEYEGENFSAQHSRLPMNCEAYQAMFSLPADLAVKIASHSRRAYQNHDAIIHLYIDNKELYRFFFNVHILAPSLMGVPRGSSFGNPSDPSGRGGFGGMGPGPSGGAGGNGEGFGGNGPPGYSFGGFPGQMGHGGVGGGRHVSAAPPSNSGPFANATLCHDKASVIWDGTSSECALTFSIESFCAPDSKQQAMPTIEQIRSCVLLCPTESRPLRLSASAALSTTRSLVFVVRTEIQSKYWPSAYCDERSVIAPLRIQFQGVELLHSSFSISLADEVPLLSIEHANLSECLVDISEELSSLSPSQADLAESCITQCLKKEGPTAELVGSHLREGRYSEAVLAAVCASVVASAKNGSQNTREIARLLRPLTLEDYETAQLAAAVPAPPSPVRPASQRTPRSGEPCPPSSSAPQLELTARFLNSTIIYDSESQSTLQLSIRSPTLSSLSELEAALTPQSLALHFLSESNTTVTRAPHSIVCHGTSPVSATVSFSFPPSDQHALWPHAYCEERDLVSPCWLRHGDQILTRGTFSLLAAQGEGSSVQSLVADGSESAGLSHCLVDVAQELEALTPSESSLIERILRAHATHRIHSSQRFVSLMGEGQYSEAILQGIVDAVAHYAAVGQPPRPNDLGLSLEGCVMLLEAYLNTLLPTSDSELSDISEELEDIASFAAVKPSDLFAPPPSAPVPASSTHGNSKPHQAAKTGEISPTNVTPLPFSSTPPSEHLLAGASSSPAPPQARPVSPPKPPQRSTVSPVPQVRGYPFSQDALMLLGAALRMQIPPQIPPTSCAQEVRPFHRNEVMSLLSEATRSGPPAVNPLNPAPHPQGPGHHSNGHANSGNPAPGSSASGKTSPSPTAAYNSGQLLTMSVSSQVSSSSNTGSASHLDFPPLPAEMTVADCTRAFKELCAQLYYAHTPADIVHLRQAYGRLTSLAAVVRDHFFHSRSEESRRLYHEMVDYARQLRDRLELLGSLTGEEQRI